MQGDAKHSFFHGLPKSSSLMEQFWSSRFYIPSNPMEEESIVPSSPW
jgi:hypothetical protein